MHVGIIGAAAVAQAVAAHAVKAGHVVTISNSRGPASLAEVVATIGGELRAGTRLEAAAADLVLLAVPWMKVRGALADLPDWNDRILMDATNHFATYAPDFRRDRLDGRTSSEIVAELAPGARVVKVFNTLPARLIAADPNEHRGGRVLFLSGDDAKAKNTVAELVASFGFAPLDLGRLADGGRIQQLDGPFAGSDLIRMTLALARTTPSIPIHRNAAAWPAVASIALGTFVMVTSEFLPIGLLGSMSTDLGVPAGRAGLMITAPGMAAAVAAPLLTLRSGRIDRRALLLAFIGLILIADLIVAMAPGLAVILAGRMLLGVALGGFWAFAASAGRRLVPERSGNRATALIMGGISIGTVLGVPMGTLLGELAGWRIAFADVAGLAGVIGAAQFVLLPPLPGSHPGSARDLLGVVELPAARIGFLAAALFAGGHFAAYTYLQPFLVSIVKLSAGGVTLVLAGYGMAGVAGTWLGERFASRDVRTAFAAAGLLTAAAIAASYLSGSSPWFSGSWCWSGAPPSARCRSASRSGPIKRRPNGSRRGRHSPSACSRWRSRRVPSWEVSRSIVQASVRPT